MMKFLIRFLFLFYCRLRASPRRVRKLKEIHGRRA